MGVEFSYSLIIVMFQVFNDVYGSSVQGYFCLFKWKCNLVIYKSDALEGDGKCLVCAYFRA